MTGRIDPRTPTYRVGTQPHLELIPSPFGFKAILKDIATPWQPPRPWLSDLIVNRPKTIFYCSTCDDMVEILPTPGFKPPPAWRSDIFKWRR